MKPAPLPNSTTTRVRPRPPPSTRGLWAEARAAWRPIATYWLFLVAMFSAFCVAVIINDTSGGAVLALAILGGVTAAGVATGQLFALLGLRDWVIWAFAIVWWTVGALSSTALMALAGTLAALAATVVILLPLFLTGGLWSLRVGRALFAAWVPLVYASGTAIIMAEVEGKVGVWQSGDKWAVWNVFTFGVLALGIVLLLANLLSREGHRLHLWRRGALAPLEGSVAESGDARPKLSWLGWLGVGALAFALSLGTAAVGPYLWRTAPDDGEGAVEVESQGDGQQQAQTDPQQGQQQSPKKGGKGGKKGKPQKQRGPQPGEDDNFEVGAREAARAEEEGQGGVVLDPVMLLILALLGLLFGWRPCRRLWLVERLRRPPTATTTTARIEGGWRLIQLAMEDAGVALRPGEPAVALAARAEPALDRFSRVDVHGLAEAAEIRDRVAYGLGVEPGDVARMDEVAAMAYDTIWDRLGDKEQIRALYRG